ncbi:MAG: UvrD-helicase domain-containing protein [Bacilli bacterium]|nr:UvrD-helicase domain-containing protein [Bacilli bacterium]
MLEGLNERQSQAAEAINGPVIVFAGAGSGKTRTLTYRILNMIVNHHINPFNILAITFTNKATNVMKERLSSYLDVDIRNLTISTFHSLCAMILRREIAFLGYNQDFVIVDEEEQLKVIDEVLKEAGYEKKRDKYYQKIINYNKCFMSKPADVVEEEIYNQYEAKMKELNMLDFEDLLLKTYELFATGKEILFKYQQRFKYILVDEFQDTNLVQYKIVKMLALTNRNLFVVGDDDQSIYSFRGTNYENMNLFKEDFPEYQIFTLNENYRSTQTILDVANRLIKNNKNREPKEMVTSIKGDIDDAIVEVCANGLDEARFVREKIESLKTGLNNYSEFAVLYRSSVLLRNFEIELIEHHIPYKVYGGVSYLHRKEVKDIIAYFRLMLNPKDTLSFKRIVNTPTRGIGLVTIEKIDKLHRDYRVDYFTAIDYSESLLPSSKFEQLLNFKNMLIKYRKKLDEDSLLNVFDELVEEIEYIKYLKDEYDKEEAKERIDNLNEFKSILYTVEAIQNEKTKIERLKEALDDAVLSDDHLQSQKENKLGVTLSTIHSVKGMEFDYVFIVGMEENLFPNSSRLMHEYELEEERRIAYVAMTRARKKLFMTYTSSRLLYGNYFNNEPSRFLLEALGVRNINEYERAETAGDRIEHKKDVYEIAKSRKITTDTATGFQIGDKVRHTVFGEGVILGIENGIGNIFFAKEKQTKKILLNHPSISKI